MKYHLIFCMLFMLSGCTPIATIPSRPLLVVCQTSIDIHIRIAFEDGNKVIMVAPIEIAKLVQWSKDLTACYTENLEVLVSHIKELEKQLKGDQ